MCEKKVESQKFIKICAQIILVISSEKSNSEELFFQNGSKSQLLVPTEV